MTKNSSTSRRQYIAKWQLIFPVLAALVVYGIIMLLAAHQSVWFDEGYTIMVAQRDPSEVINLAAVDAHPPLYYLLLKAWASAFGWGEFALRSLSAILAGLTVAGGFLLVRRLFGVKAALIILPFMTFAPFVLRYGYEIRMYALASLIGVLATYALVVAQKSNSKKVWITYAALVATGMYTLYMLAALWVAHLVWLVWQQRRQSRSLVETARQPWLYAFGLSVIFFIPQLPTFLHQFSNSVLPGIGKEITLTRLGDIWSTLLSYRSEWEVGGWLSIALVLALVQMVYIIAKVYKQLSSQQRQYLLLVILLVVLPIVFFAVTSLPPRKPIFINRYMAHVALYIYMLIGLATVFGWRYRHRVSAAMLGVTAFALLVGGVGRLAEIGNFNVERQQYPRTAQLAKDITCDASRPVIAEDPYTYIDSYYYLADRCPLLFYSADPIPNQGGYAPLHNSQDRLATIRGLSYEMITYIHWEGQGGLFKDDHRYELTSSRAYNKQVVEEYHLVSQ